MTQPRPSPVGRESGIVFIHLIMTISTPSLRGGVPGLGCLFTFAFLLFVRNHLGGCVYRSNEFDCINILCNTLGHHLCIAHCKHHG